MASEKSLHHSMNRALKHYSSLFFLPPFKKALALIAVICIGAVGGSTFLFFGSLEWLPLSLLLGAFLFAANISIDYILSNFVLRKDPVFVLRRTVGLSVFCWIVWLPLIVLGVVSGATFGLHLWVKFCLLGFSVVLTFRAVVFFSVSSARHFRAAVAALLQPCGCIIPFLLFWAVVDNLLPVQFLYFVVISPFLCLTSAFLFVSMIDQQGRKVYGVPSMSLFKAFLLNWVVGLNEPLESFLEKLGEDADVEISLLKFDAIARPAQKAAIIVPLVHPGPFKNIGSSVLPFLLKRDFERAFPCHACVPLGIMGHELDLASQKQNNKLIKGIIESAKLEASIDKATPFVKVSDGSATVSCQIFGNAAFLSFTLAPKTTEDLPQELGDVVREQAKKRGIVCSIIVNAHNSITENTEMDIGINTLCDLAVKCLDLAIASPLSRFEVGAATVYPKQFSLKDGMGEGGITAIVVKVAEQKTAYVVIDGNNMVSGLRENCLSALAEVGFEESEVFTTDTHAVSALVLGRRGYHPVGEVMNHETLLDYIREAALLAMAGLENCKGACKRLLIPQIKVIGADRIHSLTSLVDIALKKAKQIIGPIFAIEGLLLVLLLTVS